MYLSEAQIRGLLTACGFKKNVGLIVSSGGKHTGRVWPGVLQQFAIQEHLGDNQHSDVSMPRTFGVKTRYTAISALNMIEEALVKVGLRDLALLCREARLATWHDDSSVRPLQIVQASLNFPLIFLATIRLVRLIENLGSKTVLFSSRDCNLWIHLFRAMADRIGLKCDAHYFYTSRIARTQGSPAYYEYTRQLLGDDGLVVDICGSGWSLAHMFDKLQLKDRHVFFYQKLAPDKGYEAKAPTPATCSIHSVINETKQFDNRFLELCNYADHGMVLDVRKVHGKFVPVFAADRRPRNVMTAVAEQHRCFLRATEMLTNYKLDDVLAIDDAKITKVAEVLNTVLVQQVSLVPIYMNDFMAENNEVMIELMR
jgi:hypothetical protein